MRDMIFDKSNRIKFHSRHNQHRFEMSARNFDGLHFRGEPAGDDDDYDIHEMRAKLSDLKQNGSTLLVTGTVGEQTAAYASSNFFGATDASPPRKRILALTDGSCAQATAHFQGSIPRSGSQTWIIDLQEQERSIPATASPNLPALELQTNSLTALRSEIQDAIDWFARDDLEPAELRVGIDSLSYLLDEYSFSEVERLVASISGSVAVEHGMFHLVYQRDPDANRETVERLMAHCDAEIQVRKQNGNPAEQRWRIPTIGTTEWTRL